MLNDTVDWKLERGRKQTSLVTQFSQGRRTPRYAGERIAQPQAS